MEKHHKLRRDPSWSPHGCNICGVVRRRLPRSPTRGTLSPPLPPPPPLRPPPPRRAASPPRLGAERSRGAGTDLGWFDCDFRRVVFATLGCGPAPLGFSASF